jgi:hypothetical protein
MFAVLVFLAFALINDAVIGFVKDGGVGLRLILFVEIKA